MLWVFSWLSLFVEQRSSLICHSQAQVLFMTWGRGRKILWLQLTCETWNILSASWRHARTTVLLQEETWSHGPRSEAGRRGHLRDYLHPLYTRPVRCWSSMSDSSLGVTKSPFFPRVEGQYMPGLKVPLESSYPEGFAEMGERREERKTFKRIQEFMAEMALSGCAQHRKPQAQWGLQHNLFS